LWKRVRVRGIRCYSIHPPLHPLPSREGRFYDIQQLAAGKFIYEILFKT
jgi:hypothetical protein